MTEEFYFGRLESISWIGFHAVDYLIPDANLITLRFLRWATHPTEAYRITTPYFLVSLNLLNIYANCIDFVITWAN